MLRHVATVSYDPATRIVGLCVRYGALICQKPADICNQTQRLTTYLETDELQPVRDWLRTVRPVLTGERIVEEKDAG